MGAVTSLGRFGSHQWLFCGPFAQDFFDFLDVGGDVDAYAIEIGFHYADMEAVFEPAELFELLDAFKFAGRQGGKLEKGVATITVDADMFPVLRGEFRAGIADPGNGRAREIEAVAVEIADNFYYVGVHDLVRLGNGGAGRGDVHGIVVGEGLDYGVDGGGIDQGLVALYIDVNVGGDVDGDFGDAIGTSTMIGASHDCFAAEGAHGISDALIFGGDDYSGCAGCFAEALDNVLDHRTAGDLGQRLAGEANGGVARRYDN